ncbi:50S ribosomal protein L1 [Paragonimus heterotremus]|uniref:50S ribosomal protein L1 n=1 Tax=Paragonimus heterotremus TaxID=100268 RepID=A0A8J4SUX1_9TREM|nr:50S ribosomal protein L1 [Paragonimus heterotremus]
MSFVVSILRGSLLVAAAYPARAPTFLRSFTTSTGCCKGNTRRPRIAASGSAAPSEKSKARRDSARQMLANTNRTRWEENNARLAELRGKLPTTNVYLAANFEPKLFSLTDAIECLREAAEPDMFDCLQNPLRAKFTLNMQTKKKTKFIPKFEAHLVLPHLLDFMPKRRVIALCQDKDDVGLILEAGAIHAGGAELFSRLEHGTFHWEEYDTVVAHPDWATAITKLRHVLKDRLPTVKNGRLGENVIDLVNTFSNGVSIESSSLDGVPEINFLDVIVGQLAWDIEHLSANLKAYFEILELQKSSRISGDFVIGVELYCPPTGERFSLDCGPFVVKVRKQDTSPRLTVESDDVTEQGASVLDHMSELDKIAQLST